MRLGERRTFANCREIKNALQKVAQGNLDYNSSIQEYNSRTVKITSGKVHIANAKIIACPEVEKNSLGSTFEIRFQSSARLTGSKLHILNKTHKYDNIDLPFAAALTCGTNGNVETTSQGITFGTLVGFSSYGGPSSMSIPNAHIESDIRNDLEKYIRKYLSYLTGRICQVVLEESGA